MTMRTRTAGFTLMEIVVTMCLLSIAMAAIVPVLASQNRVYLQQDARVAMEQNLRLGMGVATDALRNGGYGVPTANLASWIPWISGFSTNPKITTSGTNQIISVASASVQSVASLASAASIGTTTLALTSYSQVDASSKRLLLINGQENALIVTTNVSSVTVDTDPTVNGNQGLTHAYPQGTPVYRVDVVTFNVGTDATTGLSQLLRDQNQGAGALPAVDGITGLQVTTITAGKQYKLTLSATTPSVDPLTNQYLQGTLASNIALAN
jgi:prepilin-type N-terminal cleavage/methylation domain-containing protein